MTKKITILIILVTLNSGLFAQSEMYTSAMQQGLLMMDKAQNKEDFQAVSNHFERIANVESQQWHPAYYASYARTIVAAMEMDPATKDKSLDAAQLLLEKSSNAKHDTSEVYALEGFIHMLRIGVDPMNRGQQYSVLSSASLQKGSNYNTQNPRIIYLQAQLSFGTAQFFGAEPTEACQMIDQALEIFKSESTKEKEDPFAPDWGKEAAEGFKSRCPK